MHRLWAILFIVPLLGVAAAKAPLETYGLPRHEGPDCIIYGNVPAEDLRVLDWRFGKLIANYKEWFAGFPGQFDYKPNVFLFAADDPNRALKGGGLSSGHSIKLVSRGEADRYHWAGLQHEMLHQFVGACVAGKIPSWVNEGIASYHGRMLFTGLHFYRGIFEPHDVATVRKLLDDSKLASFDTFFVAGKWDGGRTSYIRAWSMIQFLLHTEGPFKGKLRNALMEVSKQSKWDAVFAREFPDKAVLEAAYRSYWKALPEEPSADVRVELRVEALAMALGRAWGQGQRFATFEEFREAAEAGKLQFAEADWMPGVFVKDAVAFSAGEGEWSLEMRGGVLVVVAMSEEGTRIEGAFELAGTRVKDVRITATPGAAPAKAKKRRAAGTGAEGGGDEGE